MANCEELFAKLSSDEVRDKLAVLYGERDGMVEKQVIRYGNLLKRFDSLFPGEENIMMVSAPGRTEIGGNHTDHNRGKVLAASVNLDTLAVVSSRNDGKVYLFSEGYPEIVLDLNDLQIHPDESDSTAALIRGVADGMKKRGYRIGGFNAVVTSTVASGSGLSSSAAFEVMLTGILDALYNHFSMPFVERAQIGKYAENVYFGKPSGLLDQMASAAGGLVTVDFADEDPEVRAMQYDFGKKGIALIVVSTGGSHANLTPCYAAIPAEMKQVAGLLGGKELRDVPEEVFLGRIGELRGKVSDRALMRAVHFYRENKRVEKQVLALEQDDLRAFLDAIVDSGRSSFMYLQNVYASEDDQSLSLALCLAEGLLGSEGGWRIHGGGFAGTTLNFVPETKIIDFVSVMENTFGKGCCQVLAIRPEGVSVLE